MSRLTSRERLLIAIVAGTIFLLGNMTLLSSLAGRHARLQADLAAKRSEIQSLKRLLAGSEPGAGHEAWLAANQPKLTNPEQAGVQLLEQIKEAARANEVLLESPELGGIEVKPTCRSVSVQVSARGSWANTVKFLHALQQPGRFIVFETANLQIDSGNAARMLCRYKIAKWYAP